MRIAHANGIGPSIAHQVSRANLMLLQLDNRACMYHISYAKQEAIAVTVAIQMPLCGDVIALKPQVLQFWRHLTAYLYSDNRLGKPPFYTQNLKFLV